MAYIGSTPTSQNFISGTDYFNGTGSQTSFTLTRSVNSVNDVEVVVNNVIQQPNSYTVSGTTLTLSAAPSSGTSNVYVRYLATNQQSFTVGNNTVGYNQLTSDMQSKFAMKNRIINGAMVFDQRNAGAEVNPAVNGSYYLDRWRAISSQSGKYKIGQNTGSVTPPAGFTKYLGITSLSAYTSLVSADTFSIRQYIEGYNIADLGWGTADAKPVTISFWVQSSLTGTFGGVLRNSAQNRNYPFTYTITSANTWTLASITVAGDTAGTWLTTNGVGIEIQFAFGAASDVSGTAGSWSSTFYQSATGATSVVGTNGATFYITGVQLEVGTSATGFEYRQYQQELALCQRYYTTIAGGTQYMGGHAFSTNRVISAAFFPATMRANPTVTLAAGSFTYFINGASYTSSATAVSATSTGNLQIDFTATATSGSNGAVATNNTISMSAEL